MGIHMFYPTIFPKRYAEVKTGGDATKNRREEGKDRESWVHPGCLMSR